ncbi:MAG TPA: ABC transporter permease, partial [Planctomycetaceae bacterium]|nr:ABC transporter permease [Planctomycetaceae bacterium]
LYRDRRTMFVLLALPMVFISILGFSTGQLFSAGQKNRTHKVGVFDADRSDLSARIIGEVQNLKALQIIEFTDRRAASMDLAKDKIDVLLIIGPRFDELVAALDLWDVMNIDKGRLAGRLKSLDIEVHSGSFLAVGSQLVREIVFGIAYRTIMEPVVDKHPKLKREIGLATARTRPERQEGELDAQDQAAEENAPTASDSADHRTFTNIVYQILVPSYTVMFVFFIVNFMARSFINEREMGTLDRLKVAPITRTGMLLGKTFPFLVISLVQTVLLFVAGKLFYGMSWGAEPWLLLPVMLCTSLAATSLGLMVSTLVHTEAQVSAYGNFLVLTMAGISGCMMPRAWSPELMQQVGLITPHAWALIAYDQILSREVTELPVIWECCLTLLLFSVAFFAIGWWRSRELE